MKAFLNKKKIIELFLWIVQCCTYVEQWDLSVSTHMYLHLPQIGLYNLDNGRVYLGETISAHIVWKRYRIVFISVYKEHLIMFYYYLKGDDSMYVLLLFLL